MPFPATLDALKSSGYVFSNHATCRGCGDDIEWWTSPKGSKIPMNPMERGSSEAVAHFATCSETEQFRKEK